jgi:diaminobutyrate-2-oxoglutarate transaminase
MILGLNVGSTDLSKAIVNLCFENGLMIASCGTGGRVIKLIPPLTIPESDLEEGLNTLIKAVNRVMEAA